MAALVTEILEDVKRQASLPASQERFSDADLLEFLNEEMQSSLFPFLLDVNEEYGLTKDIVPLMDESNTLIYPNLTIPLPKRAYGRTLRELKHVDVQSNTRNMPLIALNDYDIYDRSIRFGMGFYFMGDAVQMYGDSNAASGSLIMHYILEPSVLKADDTLKVDIYSVTYNEGTDRAEFVVPSASIAAATGMTSYCGIGQRKLFDIYRVGSGAVLMANVPMLRTTAVKYESPDVSLVDLQELNTFQEGGFGGLEAPTFYDPEIYMLPAGQSPYTQIPSEADQLLTLYTVGRILTALGDTEGLLTNDVRIQKAHKMLLKVMGRRITGEPTKLVNRRGVRMYMRRPGNRIIR